MSWPDLLLPGTELGWLLRSVCVGVSAPFMRSAGAERTWQSSLNYEVEGPVGFHRGRMEWVGALRLGTSVMVNMVP